MLDIDIEQFVLTGVFGSLGPAPRREAVRTMLGPPDEQRVEENDQYGNVTFEFDAQLDFIYRILIAYPHTLNGKYSSSLDPPTIWPDSRFSFVLGRFQPGLSLRDVIDVLPGFEHADMIGEFPHRICVYTNRDTNVDLCFAPPTALAEHSLYCIASYPQPDFAAKTLPNTQDFDFASADGER